MPRVPQRAFTCSEIWLVALVLNAKFVLATARRMLYPFVPQLADAVGESEEAVAASIALMQLCYTLTPLAVPSVLVLLSSIRVMVLAAGVQCLCLLGVALSQSFAVFAVCVFFLGLGKGLLDPAAHVIITQTFQHSARERVSSIVECSWGMSSLIGVPLAGLLMTVSWRLPFFVTSGICILVCIAIIALVNPPTASKSDPPSSEPRPASARGAQLQQWCALLRHRDAWSQLLLSTAATCCNDTLMVVYGIWLEDAYQFSLTSVALATFCIGVADFAAEGCMVLCLERIGSPRAAWCCAMAAVLSFAALAPLSSLGPGPGIAGAFLCFVTFEGMILSLLGLSTLCCYEGAGSVLQSAQFTFQGLGRVTGTLLGPLLYHWHQMWAVGVFATMVLALGLVLYLMTLSTLTASATGNGDEPKEDQGASAEVHANPVAEQRCSDRELGCVGEGGDSEPTPKHVIQNSLVI